MEAVLLSPVQCADEAGNLGIQSLFSCEKIFFFIVKRPHTWPCHSNCMGHIKGVEKRAGKHYN